MTLALFLSLLIKSSLVAGAGLAAAHAIGRGAADRVDILRAAVCVLLALPVIAALLPSLQLAILPAPSPAPVADPLWANPLWRGEIGPVAGMQVSGALPAPSPALIAAAVWILGAVAIIGRFVLGLATLDRWTREGQAVTSAAWLAPLTRLSHTPRPRLVSSHRLSSPLSWGVSPGVIVVDPSSLTAPETAPAVLAHELAHLRRRDWVFLVLSRLAVALFWFNPLVWRLHAVLAARSEEAADAAALETIDASTYARTLVRLAAFPQRLSHAATPMAADSRTLKRRIACIMSPTSNRRRPLTVALTVVALAVVATPLAALEIREHGFEAPPLPPLPPVAAIAPLAPLPPAAPMVQSGDWSAPPAPPAPSPAPPVPPVPPVPEPAQRSMNAPPAPPAPPAAPSMPAPPAPPAPPQARVYSYGSTTWREATPEEQRAAAAARAEAVVARRQAQAARSQARTVDLTAIRAQADAARAQARALTAPRAEARQHAEAARIQAGQARAQAGVARQQATRHRAEARVQMGRGADQMRNGAREMRQESVRLRDPAYRAEQIARSREQGRTVTDAELLDLSSRLPARADEMERRADELQRRAADPA